MTLSLSHVHVYTDDPDASVAFYRDALGLEVKSEVANDGYRWITLSTRLQSRGERQTATAREYGRHQCADRVDGGVDPTALLQ